jgi:chloramphenicol-sensitive protein RarD
VIDRRGLVLGLTAYGMWGLVPLFWHLLAAVDPVEVLAHRTVWGCVVFVAIAAAARRLRDVAAALRAPRTVGMMTLSSTLLCVNWGVFVYAVAADRVLDASLGYFINPLVSVALGTIVLRERLRPLQWIAVGLAAIGVAVAAWSLGTVPWISLVLAGSFGSYGLVRKVAAVDALAGSTVETALAAPVAAAYLVWLTIHGEGAFGADTGLDLLLVATGVVTAVPLVFFTSAARRLPLSIVGFIQYITPTCQFLLAIAVFGEPLAAGRLVAFVWIWAALAVFSLDTLRTLRRGAGAAPGQQA